MNMYLSEIQDKEIISINNGLNYGKIIDIEISNDGRIVNFIAQNRKIFQKKFKNEEITFSFSQIEKIGQDVILVRV